MKYQARLKRVLSLLLAVCLALSLALPAMAAETVGSGPGTEAALPGDEGTPNGEETTAPEDMPEEPAPSPEQEPEQAPAPTEGPVSEDEPEAAPAPTEEPAAPTPTPLPPLEEDFLTEEEIAAAKEWIEVADVSWYDPNESEFTISTARQLAGLAKLVNGGNNFLDCTITLANDIDLAGKNWTPIGGGTSNAGLAFAGTLDGAGHTIAHLDCTVVLDEEATGDAAAALFGNTNANAQIKHLKLNVDNVLSEARNKRAAVAGGIVAWQQSSYQGTKRSDGNFVDIYVTVNPGGSITGHATGTSNCSIGGIIGVAWGGCSILDSFVDISEGASLHVIDDGGARRNLGGYIGYVGGNIVIERCRTYIAGELAADGVDATVKTQYIGGFAGCIMDKSRIKDCYTIIAETGKIINESSVAATAIDADQVGGIVGFVERGENRIENAYVINKGTGNLISRPLEGNTAALIGGKALAQIDLVNVYAWSADSSYPMFEIEANFNQNNCIKVPAEADMKQQSTYAGFDFSTAWIMDSVTGYPKIGTEVPLSDAEVVAKVKANLGWGSIKGKNTDANNVLYALELPTEGLNSSKIRWESKPAGIVKADGSVALADESQTVTLTAYISKGSISDQKSIVIKTGIQAAVDNWASLADTSWYDPAKTEFEICTGAALAGLAKLVNSGNSFADCTIRLIADIDLLGKEWEPIGATQEIAFKGVFDGKGHTVANLSITHPQVAGYAGLFGIVNGGTVKNLGLISGATIITENVVGDCGGIIGETVGQSKVYNCYNLASVTKTPEANASAGITGLTNNSVVINCWNGGAISSTRIHGGGVVGYNAVGSKAYNTFSYGSSNQGGLIGSNLDTSILGYSYWNSDVASEAVKVQSAAVEEVHGMTTAEMQSQAFVDTLNGNLALSAEATGIPLSELVYWELPSGGGYPILAFDLSDEDAVNKGLDYVAWDAIKGGNASSGNVVEALNLVSEAPQGVSITWTASPAGIVNRDGSMHLTDTPQEVTLTATVSKNGVSQTKDISITTGVLADATEWINVADTSWYDETKTYFEIGTAQELAGLAKLVNTGNNFLGLTVTLSNDIDLGGKNWTPIGGIINSKELAFAGTLDGAGHTIAHLDCTVEGTGTVKTLGAALFGNANANAQIKHLKLTVDRVLCVGAPGDVSASAAGLIAWGQSQGTVPTGGNVADVYVTVNSGGSITSSGHGRDHLNAGAIAAVCWGTLNIQDSFVDIMEGASIHINDERGTRRNLGGYIGYTSGGVKIERSRAYIAGEVSAEGAGNIQLIGGFVGSLGTNSLIKDCYTIITETGTIKNESTTASTAIDADQMGAIIGRGDSTGARMENVYVVNKGTDNLICRAIEGNNVGLIGGKAAYPIQIANVYAWSADADYPLFAIEANFNQTNCVRVPAEAAMKKQSTYQGFDFATTWVMDSATGYPKIGSEVELTDEQVVAKVKENLTWDAIKGSNTESAAVTYRLNLPVVGLKGAVITWASTNPAVIGTDGRVQPVSETQSAQVTLTATIRYGTASDSKPFALTVAPGFNWNTFWAEYWGKHPNAVWATVGDSITSSNVNYTAGHRYYYEWVQERLNGELGKNITVVNPAIGGWTLAQFDDAAKEWVNDYKADVVTVYFGMNDRGAADLDAVKGHLKSLVDQLLPTKENQAAYNTPVDRVIVLVTCNPVNGGADGALRDIHAYGEELAQQYTSSGYRVQYVDLYDYYKNQLDYGKNGNLVSMANYYRDSLHINDVGNYATAQFLMENMGLYSASSEICNYRHDELLKEGSAPYAGVNYLLANSGVDGEDFNGAQTESKGYANALAAADYGNTLILGGAVTSGTVGGLTGYRTWAWHVESYLRTVNGKNRCHVVTVADESYDVNWFNSKLNDLKWQYDAPGFILYMPEVNELYTDSYVHSSDKVTAYKTQLDTFVNKCAAENIELTLMTPFPMRDETKNGYLEDYVRAVVEVANERKVSLNNAYSALGQVMNTPQGRRNWYAADGYPNYIAQIEAAKTFLAGSCNERNNTLFQYTYRNANRNSGVQYDNFDLAPTKGGDTVHVDLTAVLADPFYSTLKAPTAANFGVERTTAAGVTAPVAFTYDPERKMLSYSASGTGELDAVRVKIVNGATTYLNAYTPADVEDEGVTVSGSASFGAGMVPQLEALTSAEGLTIREASAVSGDYALTRTEGTCGEAEQKSVTFAITKTGESKAAVSVTLVDASAEQAADLSNVTITFKAGSLDAQAFTFDLNTVPAGTYSVETYKKNHTTATMTGVTVGDAAVTLGQDMEMLTGDLNSDGVIDGNDKMLLVGEFNAQNLEFDLNNDAVVDGNDKMLLVGVFNETEKVYTYTLIP